MSSTLFLMGAKAVGDVANGITEVRGAKKIAKEQKKTAQMFYEFNKKQIEENYKNAFGNAMNNYIENRLNIADQYEQAQTQLNIEASQSNVNLADSSYNEDINNTLDREFNNEMQNSFANLTNQVADMVVNKSLADLQLNQQYSNQLNAINNTLSQVKQKAMSKAGESLMNFGMQAYDEYRASDAKSDLKGKSNNYAKYEAPKFDLIDESLNVDFSQFKL